jgi:hypothetical protein
MHSSLHMLISCHSCFSPFLFLQERKCAAHLGKALPPPASSWVLSDFATPAFALIQPHCASCGSHAKPALLLPLQLPLAGVFLHRPTPFCLHAPHVTAPPVHLLSGLLSLASSFLQLSPDSSFSSFPV